LRIFVSFLEDFLLLRIVCLPLAAAYAIKQLKHDVLAERKVEDTCMSYVEEDTCMSYVEEDTCMSYVEEDTIKKLKHNILAEQLA